MSAALNLWQLLGDEDDFAADLQQRGVDLHRPTSDAQLDALASEYLGEMAAAAAEIARFTEARDHELQRIAQKYEMLMAPAKIRHQRCERFVCELAQRADFGKKKSRDVGNGTYGRKTEPERVKVLDQDKAVAWARDHFPGAVKTKTTETVDHRAIAPAILARVHADGEVPDGFEHVAERETYYAKPELG